MPIGFGQNTGCGPQVGKFDDDGNGQTTVSGVDMSQFDNDHVFEIHLISEFLEWLCEGDKETKYNQEAIPFPSAAGWQRPDPTWCEPVFGSEEGTGWKFPVDANDGDPQNWIVNTATKLGGSDRPDLMALYYRESNIAKGQVTQGHQMAVADDDVDVAIQNIISVRPPPLPQFRENPRLTISRLPTSSFTSTTRTSNPCGRNPPTPSRQSPPLLTPTFGKARRPMETGTCIAMDLISPGENSESRQHPRG